MPNFRVTSVDDDVVELGVRKGTETYDSVSGDLHETVRVSRSELEDAIKNAHSEGQKRRNAKATEDKAFIPRYDPADVRADSSPRSEDRPPIYISSESNPSEANPMDDRVRSESDGEIPDRPEDPIGRNPDGLAAVPGNTQFELAPGPNEAEVKDGVKAPKPKANVSHEETAAGKKEAADAEAARNGGGSTGSTNLDDAAARALKRAADASPTPAVKRTPAGRKSRAKPKAVTTA